MQFIFVLFEILLIYPHLQGWDKQNFRVTIVFPEAYLNSTLDTQQWLDFRFIDNRKRS